MSVDTPMRSQINLILDNLRGSAAYPAPDRWDDVDDVDFLYRENTILCREQDMDRVADAITRFLDEVGWGEVPEGDARQFRRERVSATREVVSLALPATGTLVPAYSRPPRPGTRAEARHPGPRTLRVPEAVPRD